MAKIELSPQTIEAINDILDKDTLLNDIDLMETTIDDYLMDIPDGGDEARQTLDRVASLRMFSKQLSTILNSL